MKAFEFVKIYYFDKTRFWLQNNVNSELNKVFFSSIRAHRWFASMITCT